MRKSGTKLHQQTPKAIPKRQPSLISAIKRFNRFCERLEELYDPSYKIPIPAALPTKLDDLRQDPILMEDVWIERSEIGTPFWLEDQDIRTGIRAMLKRDRCREEQWRLGWEADNLCRYSKSTHFVYTSYSLADFGILQTHILSLS